MDTQKRITEIKGEIQAIYAREYSFFPIEVVHLNIELFKLEKSLETMGKLTKKEYVKVTKTGDFKVTVSVQELESLVIMIDGFKLLSALDFHSPLKPFIEIYNISADKLKIRFMNPIKYEGQTLKFTRIEAFILTHQHYLYFNTPALARIMMDIHQKLS